MLRRFGVIDLQSSTDLIDFGAEKMDHIQGAIKMHDVYFEYPERRDVPVPCEMSVKIENYKTLVLVIPMEMEQEQSLLSRKLFLSL